MTFTPEQLSEQTRLADEQGPNPSISGNYTLTHAKELYKSLSTVGEFFAYIWFREEEYDENRSEGERDVIIYGTPELMEVVDDLIQQDIIDKYVCDSGAILVNPEYRPNGVALTSNRDIRDCVRWITPLASRFNGSANKIWVYNPDTDQYHRINYDSIDSTMNVEDDAVTYESTFGGDEVQGSISKSFSKLFGSGAISMKVIIDTFSNGNNLSNYYRGKGVVNISENNNVPTSGTIAFSAFRNVCSGITATCSGNFTHLRARQDIFGDSVYDSKLPKTINMNGTCGSDGSQPALRLNQRSDTSTMTANMNGNAIGFPGNKGGGNGLQGCHVASPVKINGQNKIKGGGGGGGNGGNGGKGGGGGHSGTQKCNKWFCKNTKRKCRIDGGNGGNGGNGGQGGRGKGYLWNGSSWYESSTGGQGGNSGSGGNKNGGKGGNGGAGGTGGNWGDGSNGNTGQAGNKGQNGGNDEEGCGYNGNKQGQSGNGGNGGGSGAPRFTFSSNGNVS